MRSGDATGFGALRPAVLATLLLTLPLAFGAGARSAHAEYRGVVFLDTNGDGVRDPGERGVPGVFLSNGRDTARSDGDGHYALPEFGRFVFLTRSERNAPRWYAERGGDFGLVAREPGDSFFFVHVSDAHVYDRVDDFRRFSSPIPGWIPRFLANWLGVWQLGRTYGSERLRASLEETAEGSAAGGLSTQALLGAYLNRFAAQDDAELVATIGEAFDEIAALAPDFVVHTGDLVLESNRGSAEAVERWIRFYRGLRDATGIPFHDTIGNNEIAGTENPDFAPDDPRYGRALFHRYLGPSHYSFDYGDFHFVALDTHRAPRERGNTETWSFGRMEDEVRSWLDADLAAHADRVLVILNHEPFHVDPTWPFEPDPEQTADDEGLFARHGVEYVLSGHTHFGSHRVLDGIVHTTAGALSGLRWLLPASLHERGYRLYYAHRRALYSAWKQSGEPLVAFAQGPSNGDSVVLAVAAARGPYAEVTARAAGRHLEVERLGRYFVRVATPPGALQIDLVDPSGNRHAVELAAPE